MLAAAQLELEAEADRRRYDDLFEACPGAFIQQSTLWADAVAPLGPDRPMFLVCGDGRQDLGGLPLYLHERPSGAILTSVPQAGPLGGIFTRDDLGDELRSSVYRVLLERALELAERHACLSLSLITNPFRADLELYERHLRPDYVLENFTQYIALKEPMRRSGGQRNNLARARRFGFRLEAEETLHGFEGFYALHERRHRELGAVPLAPGLLRNLFQVLVPRKKAILLAAKHGDTLAAGGFYVHHARILDVYAISMDSACAAHAPNALLADASIAAAAAAGREVYNWQSSPSRASGVYAHKGQWGSREARYAFVTRLLCPPDRILALGPDGLRSEYAGHYVLPFGVFTEGFGCRVFRKA